MVNDRPWMIALDMQSAAEYFLRTNEVDPAEPDAPLKNFRLNLEIQAIRTAPAFAWTDEIVEAVSAASASIDLSTTLSQEMLYGDIGWWWLGHSGNAPSVALLWRKRQDGVLLSFLSMLPGTATPYSEFVLGWKLGDSLRGTVMSVVVTATEHDFGSESERLEKFLRFFLAGCAWLQQRIAVEAEHAIERHLRKRISRQFGTAVSTVKVIALRRRGDANADNAASDSPVEWSCRWIVNGHWRNQPYKSGRRLLYILPYVKGPSDKPLKTPSRTVFAVTR